MDEQFEKDAGKPVRAIEAMEESLDAESLGLERANKNSQLGDVAGGAVVGGGVGGGFGGRGEFKYVPGQQGQGMRLETRTRSLPFLTFRLKATNTNSSTPMRR